MYVARVHVHVCMHALARFVPWFSFWRCEKDKASQVKPNPTQPKSSPSRSLGNSKPGGVLVPGTKKKKDIEKALGKAHFKVTILAQQQVLRLEVTVRHRQLVQVLQRENHAPTEERRHRQRETPQTALRDWRMPFIDVGPVA